MPTSATGHRTSHRRGFTLVELLVVLAIMAVAASAVVMTIPDPRGSLADEGTAFAARLAAARDLAIVGGRDVSARVDAGGYAFDERRADGWRPVGTKAFGARRWGEGVAARLEAADGPRIVFDTTGLATPAQIWLTRDGLTSGVTVGVAGTVRVDAR